ncbi:MAG: TRAP transporter large permease [Hyphomicrobiaceae bacterium]
MDVGTLSLFLVLGVLVLLIVGVPIVFAAGLVGIILGYANFGTAALGLLMQRVYGLGTEYLLLSVPLFLFMAALIERSGIAREMFDAVNAWLGRVRGGVLLVTAVMGALMAAMSGIIGGEIVILGLVALPQMLRLGYERRLAIGMVCASGSLGTMIPPSIVLIVYGLVSGTSIGDLFLAGIIPGLMLAASYIAYALVRCHYDPNAAPEPDTNKFDFTAKLNKSWGLVAPIVLVTVIFGSIYGSLTSITESAAIGVIATLLIMMLRGEFDRARIFGALEQTFTSVGIILWVTFGATMLTGAYSLLGGPNYIANAITDLGLSPLGTIVAMLFLFVLLGMFIDWIGILLLAIPVLVPLVQQLDFDKVWFGILFCLTMQISYLSPPFGPAAFYLKSVAPPDVSIVEIFRSFLPFIVLQLMVITLVLLFPQLALVLT